MANDTGRNKNIEVERTKKLLHQIGSCPPTIDPFSREGAQEWSSWTETCRNLESELRAAGCDF
jgi:hypothetical protein